MTEMMARVRGAAEVEDAIAGGADALVVWRGTPAPDYVDVVAAVIEAVLGRRPVWAVAVSGPDGATERGSLVARGVAGLFVETGQGGPAAATPEGVRIVAVLRTRPSEGELDLVRASDASTVLLACPGRAVDAMAPGELAGFAQACRDRGLGAGVSGGLEAPDVPRLIAFGYDLLVFRRALCAGGDPAMALTAEATRLIRDLVPGEGSRPASSRAVPSGPADRIFVRDLVLPMAIGAYASEIGRTQRVRFSVEAEIVRAAGAARDMRDVVSYDLITDAIRHLALAGHVELVETLAEGIAERVLDHPRVVGVRVVVEKLDVGPGSVGVEIRRDRADLRSP